MDSSSGSEKLFVGVVILVEMGRVGVVGVGSGRGGGGRVWVSLLTVYTSDIESWDGSRDRIVCSVGVIAISDVHSPEGESLLFLIGVSIGICREDCRWRKQIGHSSLTC